MSRLAGFVTLLVAYIAAFLLCPTWLETDVLRGLLAALGVGVLAAVWYAAFDFAFHGVGERDDDE